MFPDLENELALTKKELISLQAKTCSMEDVVGFFSSISSLPVWSPGRYDIIAHVLNYIHTLHINLFCFQISFPPLPWNPGSAWKKRIAQSPQQVSSSQLRCSPFKCCPPLKRWSQKSCSKAKSCRWAEQQDSWRSPCCALPPCGAACHAPTWGARSWPATCRQTCQRWDWLPSFWQQCFKVEKSTTVSSRKSDIKWRLVLKRVS